MGTDLTKRITNFGFAGYHTPRVSSARISPLALKKSIKQLQNASTEKRSDRSSCADYFLLQSS